MLTSKILIVDDDPDDREILIETFHQVGLQEVHGVSSAEAAIVFLQTIQDNEHLPKLIITDLNMPGISGHDLLRALKSMRRYQHIPVVVCSTSRSIRDVDSCISSGAKEYITKPSAITEYIKLTQKLTALVPA